MSDGIAPIRAEAIRTLYDQALFSTGSAVLLTAYLALTACLSTAWLIIAAWAVCSLCLIVLRVRLARTFKKKSPKDEDLERWARLYTLHSLAAGAVRGATIFLFANPDDPITVALTLSGLTASASGSVASYAYNPPSLAAIVMPMFGAVMVRLIAVGSPAYILLGIASGLYALMMLELCRQQARLVDESFRIRFENRALIEALDLERAEAERARRQAESASLAKSQFLAAASHDLRQPLYALNLFSASLESLQLDAEGRLVVTQVQETIAAMESLFIGLLDLSRLDAGVMVPKIEPVSVDLLFDRLSQYFRPSALERGLDLRIRSDGEWVLSDVTLLEQVLSNLVSNALRYTERGGVLIAARGRAGRVRFEVWDTGIGIRESDVHKIFEEFVQLGNTERDRRKGLGLGLSIAQRSAALLGSPVIVASRIDRGTRFTVSQPVASPPPTSLNTDVAVPPEAPVSVSRSTRPVLIVDDDHAIRAALSNLLTRWNVMFDLAVDAEDALARLAQGERYGLIITDYRLAGLRNGLDLIDYVMRREDGAQIVCALVTGDLEPDLIASAQRRGVQVFHKPLNPTALRALIEMPR